MTDFICVSHLRWNTFEREYPLPWRFLHKARVVFVEPPLLSLRAQAPELEKSFVSRECTVVRLLYPSTTARVVGHGHPEIQPIYNQLLERYLNEIKVSAPILWLYTPAGVAFAEVAAPQIMIYDTVDRLNGRAQVSVERLNPEAIVLSGREMIPRTALRTVLPRSS